jgi:hypothetical protein
MNVYKVHYVAYLNGVEWGDNVFVRAKTRNEALRKAEQEIYDYCDSFDELEAVRVSSKDLPILKKYFTID